MSKSFQISEELFINLLKYHVSGIRTPEIEQRITTLLQAKLDAYMRRELYSQSKLAETPEERERARQQYLDEVGIHADFRW